MTKQGTILVVDDNKGILTAVQMLLGTYFEKVITISTPNKIKATLHDENIDVVLLDMNFSAGINTGNEGLFWLSEIKKEDASIQVFFSRPMRTSTLPYGESRKERPISWSSPGITPNCWKH